MGARAEGVQLVVRGRLVLLSQSLEVFSPLLLVFVCDLPDAFL